MFDPKQLRLISYAMRFLISNVDETTLEDLDEESEEDLQEALKEIQTEIEEMLE